MKESYEKALHECGALMLSLLLGLLARAFGLLPAGSFTFLNNVVFYVGIPPLVFRALAKQKLKDLNWDFVLAFLVLRVMGFVIASLSSTVAASLRRFRGSPWSLVMRESNPHATGDASEGKASADVGPVTRRWDAGGDWLFRMLTDFIGITWINTIIFGVPILTAMYGSPRGTLYPVLASLSSFMFQLPFLLMSFETASERRAKAEAAITATATDAPADDGDLEGGEGSATQGMRGGGLAALPALPAILPPGEREAQAASEEDGEAEGSAKGGLPLPLAVLWRMLRTPAIGAIILGLLYSGLIAEELPQFIDSSFTALGSTVSPMATVAVGVFVYEKWPRSWGAMVPRHLWQLRMVVYVVCKMMLLPLVAWGVMQWFDLTEEEEELGVLVSAMPLAISAFVFTTKYDADAPIMAGAIVLTTLATLPTVISWIAIIGA